MFFLCTGFYNAHGCVKPPQLHFVPFPFWQLSLGKICHCCWSDCAFNCFINHFMLLCRYFIPRTLIYMSCYAVYKILLCYREQNNNIPLLQELVVSPIETSLIFQVFIFGQQLVLLENIVRPYDTWIDIAKIYYSYNSQKFYWPW